MMLRSWKRGLRYLACALLVSLATWLMVGPFYVRFGILHLIAVTTFLLPFLLPLREWNALLAVPVFLFGHIVQARTVTTSLLIPLGLLPAEFASVDYFPIFPWMAAILLGFAAGNLLYNRTLGRVRLAVGHWHMKDSRIARALGWPGRHSLLLYMIHQPVIYGALWIIFHA